jgi:hypothetical protein
MFYKMFWSRAFQIGRAALLATWAVAAVWFVVGSAFHAYGQERNTDLTVASEHRITALETGMDRFASDLKELKTLMWFAIFGTAGVAGETGYRVLAGAAGRNRRRRAFDERD